MEWVILAAVGAYIGYKLGCFMQPPPPPPCPPRPPTGILSDRDLRREIANGKVILFDPERDCQGNIQNCSIDITLGQYFYRNERILPVLNPWNADHVRSYWGDCQKASTATAAEAEQYGLKIGQQYIFLAPGETILGHTREFIGTTPGHITTMMKARSSSGRSNLTIARDAGYGDNGYFNRWTLEITNNGTCPLILPIGSRVGQLVFFYTGEVDNPYTGKYQTCRDLDMLVESWSPSQLLPRNYLDKEIHAKGLKAGQ